MRRTLKTKKDCEVWRLNLPPFNPHGKVASEEEYMILNQSFVILAYLPGACNEFAGPISASLRLHATQLLSKNGCSSGEPLAAKTDPIFEPQISGSRDERSTNLPVYISIMLIFIFVIYFVLISKTPDWYLPGGGTGAVCW